VGAAASQGAASSAVEANAPSPAPVPVLAEASNPDGSVVVQVLEVKRATADTLRVTLAFTSKAAETASDKRSPLFPADADPGDFCLVTADGARRLFLLRDAQNQPVIDGSLQPLRPGERRVLLAMFPAPPAQSGPVTLRLGKLALRSLPISQ
jgi:hypothetical protein